ncbi:MAG TPA: T9SS type A sorting domain-containing protein, partial [Bacteroidales bacterium]|nr:T9SS type A sorting domain-containing protein [Bacteroidales bacterium]
ILGGQDENNNVSENMYIFYPATNTIETISYINQETSEHTNINIYPNPASSYVQFSSSEQSNFQYVQIIDCTGKIVLKTEVISNNKIDISELNSGIYFIRFDENNSNVNYKLIKY